MHLDKDKNLEIYYDHYRETNNLSKEAQSRRNKNYAMLCLLEAISFMMVRNPDLICGILNDATKIKLETTIQISNGIIQTLVWILIAYVLVRYIQDVLYIERQYEYLNALEQKIVELLGEKETNSIFAREGDYYLKSYPIILNLIDLFYKFFSPIFFTVINIVHIIREWQTGTMGGSLVADTAICVVIVLITVFYFFAVHSKISERLEKCRPIGWMTKLIRKLFKEV